MKRLVLLTTLLAMGCATADSVKNLEEEIIAKSGTYEFRISDFPEL